MRKLSPIFRLSIALLTVLTLVLVNSSSSYGQESSWSEPFQLTGSFETGVFPEIIADDSGRVHAFWSSSAGDYDLVLYRYSDQGKEWSETKDIQALYSPDGRRIITRPVALYGPDGRIHMLFRNNTVFYTSVEVEAVEDASAWEKPVPAKVEAGNSYFSNMAIDSSGGLHLVFTENLPTIACPECLRLHYQFSQDGGLTWSAPIPVSELNEGMAKPVLAIDKNDTLHMVWESGRGGDLGATEPDSRIRYASLEKGSEAWSRPTTFSTADLPFGKNPAMAIDANSQLIVTWLSPEKDAPYYSLSLNAGRTWTEAQPIPGVVGGWSIYQARTDGSTVATDSSGNLHFVMIGRVSSEQTGLSVLHLTWDGEAWGVPDPVVTLEGDVPEWPSATISLGNQLHVVWFVRDEENIWVSDAGVYHVWTAHSRVDAPALKPVSYAKPTETQAKETPSGEILPVTETATIEPTRTPDPAIQISPTPPGGNPLGIGQPVYKESDYLTLLAKTLLPSLLFLGVVIGVVAVRRRSS